MSSDDTGDSNMENNNDDASERTGSRERPLLTPPSGLFQLIPRFDSDRQLLGWDEDSSDESVVSTLGSTSIEIRSTPKVLLKPKPKHNWFMVKELIRREYNGAVPPTKFTHSYYGSLHAVQRLELMYKLEAHDGCVNTINFNPSGTRLISGSDDRTVAVWDWTIGKCLTVFNTGHTGNVFQCKYLPLAGDKHIVTCSRDGQVRLAFQDSTGKYQCHTKLAHHTKACHKITTLPHTPHVILSAGEDAQVLSIDVREKKPTRLIHVKEKKSKISLYSISSNPMTGNEFCVAGEDYYIRMFDRRYLRADGNAEIKFKPSNITDAFSIYVTCAVFNYNGTEVIGSYNDDDIYLFDAKGASDSDFVHKYEGHRNAETVKGVNFYGPKSEFVVSGSDCGNIYIWDKNTEAIVQWMTGDEEGVVNCLEPHPNVPVLATSGLDPDIKIWIPSCETDPTLKNLAKCVRMNQSVRELGASSRRSSVSFNPAMVNRWWRVLRDGQIPSNERPHLIDELDALGLNLLNGSVGSTSSMSSVSSSSSSD